MSQKRFALRVNENCSIQCSEHRSVRFRFWFLRRRRNIRRNGEITADLTLKRSLIRKNKFINVKKCAVAFRVIFAHHRRRRSAVTRLRCELRAGRVIVRYACCTRKHGSGCPQAGLRAVPRSTGESRAVERSATERVRGSGWTRDVLHSTFLVVPRRPFSFVLVCPTLPSLLLRRDAP